MLRKDGGSTISGRRPTRTGQLDRRTLLHKRYHVQRVIGQGGMGAVYLAKDLKDQGQLCAIKEMSLSMVEPADQPQAIQNFKIEAKILWGLDHPNLPKLIGFFQHNQRYYLVMEYIHGETLEDLLERGGVPFPERRVMGWARQLCDVLHYLHSQKPPIIFRDIKPGNIMLTRGGQIKLIDFGIARFFRPTYAPDTQVLGTPGYAPPEQYGKSQTDERSDIYALGMTLFHLLTNTLSEQGFGLERVHERYPRISPMLARALEKATEMKVADRYQSIEEFQHALFDVGTFIFESGKEATTPEELARLAMLYPDEALDYLQNGEIEAWLRELGEEDFAQVAHYLKDEATTFDALEELLNVILNKPGSNHSSARTTSSNNHHGSRPTQASNPGLGHAGQPVAVTGRSRQTPPRTIPIHVSPGMLDFGNVYPGISSPMNISIRGSYGYPVTGSIYTEDPWIQLSTKEFDGIVTDVSVRVHTRTLQRDNRYSGKITIMPEDEEQRDVVVKVAAQVQDYGLRNRRNPNKTNNADLDEYDDDEDYEEIIATGIKNPTRNRMSQPHATVRPTTRQTEEEKKYSSYDSDTGQLKEEWELAPATPLQRLWQKRITAGVAAFMAASLIYTLLAHIQPLPLPPNPLFILILTGMVPAATMGALIAKWEPHWQKRDTINRALTSLVCGFLSLVCVEALWQISVTAPLKTLQLLVMLTVVAVGATVGMHKKISHRILSGIQWLHTRLSVMPWLLISLATVVGSMLGYLLTIKFPFSFFTVFGMLLGIGIALALVLRVSQPTMPVQQPIKQTVSRRQKV